MESDTTRCAGGAQSALAHRTTWTEAEDPSAAVVELVAEVAGCGQTELEPLHYSVDGDALNALFADADTAQLDVTFSYEGYDVRVSDEGFVEVRE